MDLSLLLENLSRKVVRILQREKKALHTWIRNVVLTGTPGQWSETSENTTGRVQNQSDRIRTSVAQAMKSVRLETISRTSI
jgi:hypothetical protein